MRALLYISLIVALLGLQACERGFEELNQNPNISTEADPDALFAQAQRKFYTDYYHGVLTEIWALSTWMQMQASINGISSAGDEYFIGGDGIDNSWRILYADVLGNLSEAMRLTADDPAKVNHYNEYRIFRAYVYSRITDMWGSIPFSEAHNALNDENEPDFTPGYDDQSDVYTALLTELDQAVDALDASKATPGTQDWLYSGSVSDWKRFGNTLRLRLSIRLSEVDPQRAATLCDALVAQGNLISDNSEGAHFPYSGNSRSPFYELHSTGQGMYHPSAYLIDMLKADNDPRIEALAEPTPQSIVFGTPDWEGVPNFLLSSDIDPQQLNDFKISYISDEMLENDRPGTTISAAESYFLQAEAAWHGWTAGDPAALYYSGIEAHMQQLGISDSLTQVYVQGAGLYDGSLEQIITEKWKTFVYTDPIEAWNEFRRTGFPVLTDENSNPIDANNVPKRLAYPVSETSLNSENVSAVGHGINDFDTPVWWDK